MAPQKGPQTQAVSTAQVRAYWEEHPLFSLEITEGYGSEDFFRQLEEIKTGDTECFTSDYWRFAGQRGRRVLDVGCGPGWYSVQYARGGAAVTAMDLSRSAVGLATEYARLRSLPNLRACQADAQNMPFADGSFDLVASSGVLHHVPEPQAAFQEVRRVLKPTGEAKITLYYRNFLLRNRLAFRMMLLLLRLLGVRHHDVRSGVDPLTPEDFVRMYDGRNNPLGVAMSDPQWRELFGRAGLEVLGSEVHFFPLRFIPQNRYLAPLRRFLESRLGFLIYYRLRPRS